jgi:hypothetical protein
MYQNEAGGSGGGVGGAIFVASGTLRLINSLMHSNTAALGPNVAVTQQTGASMCTFGMEPPLTGMDLVSCQGAGCESSGTSVSTCTPLASPTPAPAPTVLCCSLGHANGGITFPDLPDEWTTDATRPPSIDEDFLINVGLHVHCNDYAPGAKAIALGNYHESVGSWVVNEDGTISPHDGPHLILGWGDFTTASGSCGADNMNMDPQPNNLVLMDSATALGCEAAREADPAQMCAPVFRARGVDCDDAGHDHGSACDGLHPMAGWTGEACSWAHGETHGCPIANVPRHRWESDLWSCDQLCGEIGGRCNRAAYMSNNHCGSDVTEQFEISCWDHVNGMGAWVENFDPEHALCWCEADDTDHWWHYYDEDDDDDDGDGATELVMSGGLVAIGLTFTGITIATVANLMQEQCALGPTIIFEAGTTHPYYISPNLCTIGTHTYASKKTVRDASPRKVCRKFCEAASAAGKLALKHVQGLTCYCKRQ